MQIWRSGLNTDGAQQWPKWGKCNCNRLKGRKIYKSVPSIHHPNSALIKPKEAEMPRVTSGSKCKKATPRKTPPPTQFNAANAVAKERLWSKVAQRRDKSAKARGDNPTNKLPTKRQTVNNAFSSATFISFIFPLFFAGETFYRIYERNRYQRLFLCTADGLPLKFDPSDRLKFWPCPCPPKYRATFSWAWLIKLLVRAKLLKTLKHSKELQKIYHLSSVIKFQLKKLHKLKQFKMLKC